MKSNLLLAGLLLAGSLASCKLDNDVSELSQQTVVNQLIIPDDESKPVTVQTKCEYKMNMDLNASTMTINSGTVSVNGMNGMLSAGPFKYAYGYAGYGESFNFKNASGRFGAMGEVTDLNGYLTTFIQTGTGIKYGLILGYKANGAQVKTFYQTQLYSGTTKTTYQLGPAGDKTAETDEATYGIAFAEDMKTANVVIYNIKFAPEMPKALEAVILKNLDVTLDRNGYTISGTDIIPEVKEGSGTTPYENYPFRSFTFKPVNDDLTEARCDYVVSVKMGPASMDFTGEFAGRYANYVRGAGEDK